MSQRVVLTSKPRILLVEDEQTLREHLARALSDEYIVDTAGNGHEALRAVLNDIPELVVTDIVMPGLDGIELLKALRSTRRTKMIPVLLISGRAIDEQRIAGFDEGADAFLAKPYTERELRACIGSMLRGARGRREAAQREAREQAERQALVDRAELLESISDAFYALDRAFRFTYVNQRALEHFGETGRRPRKSEFLAVLSHELRNPLGALRNGLHILQQRSALDALPSEGSARGDSCCSTRGSDVYEPLAWSGAKGIRSDTGSTISGLGSRRRLPSVENRPTYLRAPSCLVSSVVRT